MKKKTVYLIIIFCLFLFNEISTVLAGQYYANSVTAYTVPTELQTDRFAVKVNGKPVQVGRAVSMVFYTNFDFTGTIEISVTASNPRFWEQGVLVSPMIRRIYPKVNGGTITFTLSEPAKLTIERPGNRKSRYSGGGLDTMLCVFANPPETNIPSPADTNVIYLGPGTYNRNIDLSSNKTLYLDGNAFLKGSVNVFNAQNTKIKGRGVIFYSDPSIRKCMTVEGTGEKNTRPLTTSGARNLNVDGVIMISRAIRWMVLLNPGSSNITFNNVKIMGMQEDMSNDFCVDGIDSRGTGTRVNDCFLRCGDNIFGFWGSDYTVTNSYCWTRGANLAMIIWGGAWTAHVKDFVIRNCDVVNLDGALVEANSGNAGGTVDNLVFDNIRCEYIGAITNIHGSATITNHTFRKIWIFNPPSPGGPLSSSGSGSIDSVIFEKLRFGNTIAASAGDTRLNISGPVKVRFYTDCRDGEPTAIMKTTGIGPVTFDAIDSRHPKKATIVSYRWDFGDGESASGMTVTHAYDKPGNYRVFLTVTDNNGMSDMTTLVFKNVLN